MDNGFGLLDGSLRSSGGYNYDGLVIHGLKSSRWFFVLDSMFPMCFSVVGKPLFCGMIDMYCLSHANLMNNRISMGFLLCALVWVFVFLFWALCISCLGLGLRL